MIGRGKNLLQKALIKGLYFYHFISIFSILVIKNDVPLLSKKMNNTRFVTKALPPENRCHIHNFPIIPSIQDP
ncbi:hypothetical protein BIV60_09975 [Bacillus sp. MUM 116]|nr:hypothetical protein BIV60_09975 [Bacillus sp. MUM 116]